MLFHNISYAQNSPMVYIVGLGGLGYEVYSILSKVL